MSATVRSLVERHARALEDAGKAMERDGVGLHATRGHVQVLKRMAEAMRADAAQGRTPHQFADYPMYASSESDTGLPFSVGRTLAACGIDLAKNDTIGIADLNASMDAAAIDPGDRILLKSTLARIGRLTA